MPARQAQLLGTRTSLVFKYTVRAENFPETFVAKNDKNRHFLSFKHIKERAAEVAKYFFRVAKSLVATYFFQPCAMLILNRCSYINCNTLLNSGRDI